MGNNVGKLSQMCCNMVLSPTNKSLINQSIFKNINCVNPKTLNTLFVFHFQGEDRGKIMCIKLISQVALSLSICPHFLHIEVSFYGWL